MAVIKSEFALALNQIATERGITADEVIESIKSAVVAAYHREYPESIEDTELEAHVDKNSGEISITKGSKNVTPPGFGRIAAQAARNVIMQKIRDAEKKTVIGHYTELVGTLVRGRVIRSDGYQVYVDIGKSEAVLPKDQQIRHEPYTVNESYVFYLQEISEDRTGRSRIIISRAHPSLMIKLFEREVPEVASGAVEIKNVVREPGERAKIAVFSSQSGVDPVGACVGQKGVRVQTVTDELGGREKIDIIQWSDDVRTFIASALSPAKISSLAIDEEIKRCVVTVTEDQAPLAIGKGGVNVNLASRLTGYTLDIEQTDANGTIIKKERRGKNAEAEEVKEEAAVAEKPEAPVAETPEEPAAEVPASN